MTAGPTIGVDVGGTTTQVVRIDAGVPATARATTTPADPASLADAVTAAIAATLVDGELPARIGIGIPGQVEPLAGVVRHAVNLGVGGEPLALGDAVRSRWPVPVLVENDVRAAALGARAWLAEEDRLVPDLAYLAIGTGISAGVVLGGVLHRGRDGLAGEIGHIPVVPDGVRCPCGLDGCLETVASGTAIARRWPSPDGRSAFALFAAAEAGDARAAGIARDVAGHLAGAVHWLLLTYGVDVVVLGGGVGAGDGPLFRAVQAELAARAGRSALARHVLRPDRVLAAPADRPIGALGAAALAADVAGSQEQASPAGAYGKEAT